VAGIKVTIGMMNHADPYTVDNANRALAQVLMQRHDFDAAVRIVMGQRFRSHELLSYQKSSNHWLMQAMRMMCFD